MTKMFAMAIPILQGKTQQWKKFVSELKSIRKEEFEDSRQELKIRERTFLQMTANGDMVIVTIEGNDPLEAFKTFASGNDEFSKWFLKNVKEIHGMDLLEAINLPAPEMVIDTGKVSLTFQGSF